MEIVRLLCKVRPSSRLGELLESYVSQAAFVPKGAYRIRQPGSASARQVDGVDQLTDAELSVLRLLRSELSQREIGTELFISVNTVKTHARNIYRKLGVATRDEAVQRAKQLSLL